MAIDTAAVTNNANSKAIRIMMVLEKTSTPTPERMNAIAAIVDEWRAGVGPVHAPPAPRPDLVEMLRAAESLLGDSRCSMTDPGLARQYGQSKARLRDRILDLLAGA